MERYFPPKKGEIHFAGALENNEDTGTLQYLASTAMEAGFSTRVLDMQALDLAKWTIF